MICIQLLIVKHDTNIKKATIAKTK